MAGLDLQSATIVEALALWVGHAYEQATEWHLRHPDEAMRALQGEAPRAPKS
jgi:hypothetical protein